MRISRKIAQWDLTLKPQSVRGNRAELSRRIPQSGAFLTRPALELHQPHRRRADRGLRLESLAYASNHEGREACRAVSLDHLECTHRRGHQEHCEEFDKLCRQCARTARFRAKPE